MVHNLNSFPPSHFGGTSTHMASPLLTKQLADAVVERLTPGLRPSLDLEVLTAIYNAWCHKIPFDNLQKRISLENGDALLPGDNPQHFFRDWIEYGVGGTCWAGSTALFALLRSLGFSARRIVATMHLGKKEAPNHGTIIVRLDSRSYLVDTSILHRTPLLLPEVGTTADKGSAWGVSWIKTGKPIVLRWQPLHLPEGCLCSLWRSKVGTHRFCQENQASRHWSPFNYSLHARVFRDNTVIGIAEGHRLRIAEDGTWSRTPLAFAEILDFLHREMGISRQFLDRLPPDRPTPSPPKRTANAPQTSLNQETSP